MSSLGDVGEFGLIDRITAGFANRRPDQFLTTVGDDCAVLEAGGPLLQLLSKDLLLEGVHFDLSYVPLHYLGWKAISVNVSDVCAMNGHATGVLVGVGASNRFSPQALDELYRGIRSACEEYQLTLLGGDLVSSQHGLFLSVSVLGEVDADRLTLRSGAQDGHILCVTGTLGAALAGLQILEREKQVWLSNPDVQPDVQEHSYVVSRQLRPLARTDWVHRFEDRGVVPSAMLDLSDGLASDLQHLAKSSGLGLLVFQDKLPVDALTAQVAKLFNQPASSWALYGGEDYELCFTLRPSDYERLTDLPDFYPIGYCTAEFEGVRLQFADGQQVPVEPLGWQHFAPSAPGEARSNGE